MADSSHKHRVFVVDDEEVIAWTLAIMLRRQGFDVTAFTEPLKALQAAQSGAPDFLLTDVMMPLLSGIDLAIQVRERSPGCKVLLISGHLATTELLEAARAEGHHFEIVAKPADPVHLIERIRQSAAPANPLDVN